MKINIFGDECMSVEKRTPISVKEAIKRIMKQHVEVKNININLDESLGHILAEDIVATYDIPRFNKSTMGLQLEVKIHKVQVAKTVLNLK